MKYVSFPRPFLKTIIDRNEEQDCSLITARIEYTLQGCYGAVTGKVLTKIQGSSSKPKFPDYNYGNFREGR